MSNEFVIDVAGGVVSGLRADPSPADRRPGAPLIVALHGGSYSAAYFDVPGFSLLDRAAAAGCSAIAIDRPGYRSSTLPDYGESLHEANVEILNAAIGELWERESSGASGIVLVGHSIGGALSIMLAGSSRSWPLLGLAVSAVAFLLPPAGPAYVQEGEVPIRIDIPNEARVAVMFGPVGTYDDDAPERASIANQPVVYAEVAEMNGKWEERREALYGRIDVPVLLRLGEHDHAWAEGDENLARVRSALSGAPIVDVARVPAAGHLIDFHHTGAAFQAEEIAFALACANLD
jgi:pimeloyl-ACP methyl ester carboxylesterase